MPADQVAYEPISETLAQYLLDRLNESEMIDADRRIALRALARHVGARRADACTVQLTFICTHNSRRSHLAMIWAAIAAARRGIGPLETYSGGTEATAFHPNAVAAIERAGLLVERATPAPNPIYRVRHSPSMPELACVSKRYDQAPNPTEGFAAIMVCDHADANCPVIPGVEKRFSIQYTDPKAADDTPGEADEYDRRCAQIAREMLWLFSQPESGPILP